MKAALPPEPIRSALIPPLTAREWLEFLLVHVPIIRWVWTYQARFLVGDIIAGITVAIMHIPQGERGKWEEVEGRRRGKGRKIEAVCASISLLSLHLQCT